MGLEAADSKYSFRGFDPTSDSGVYRKMGWSAEGDGQKTLEVRCETMTITPSATRERGSVVTLGVF